jgi:glycosidase
MAMGKVTSRGSVRQIHYLEWLGTEAIWLTPIHGSLMRSSRKQDR